MAFGTEGVFQGAQAGSIGAINKAGSPSSGGGSISGGVISGLTKIATGMINANRIKDIANFNSQMLDLDKRLERLSAGIQIKNIRRNAQSLFSTQRAGFARKGLSIEGGQAAVMMESLKQSELDVIFTEINRDLSIGSISTRQSIMQMQAKSQALDEYIDIGTSILKTTTKSAGR